MRRPVQLVIVGPKRNRKSDAAPRPDVDVVWLGEVSPDQVPFQLRSADLLYSADVHPACPNSVIEALACGLPVVAFDTGAVSEIVDGRCGAVVPYGGDSWKLDPPDFASLTAAARGLLAGGRSFREGARRRAESEFGLERMLDEYLELFGWM